MRLTFIFLILGWLGLPRLRLLMIILYGVLRLHVWLFFRFRLIILWWWRRLMIIREIRMLQLWLFVWLSFWLVRIFSSFILRRINLLRPGLLWLRWLRLDWLTIRLWLRWLSFVWLILMLLLRWLLISRLAILFRLRWLLLCRLTIVLLM